MNGLAPKVTCPICNTESEIYKDKKTERVYCPVCQFPIDSHGPIPLDDMCIARFVEMVKRPMMILFWAPWEKQSDEMLTILGLEVQRPRDRMVVAAINVAENPESRRQYGIEILPTFVVFAFGREINRVVGAISSFEISQLMQRDFF
ncbi:hypothetical protein JW823_04155 [bacterium]|nr:hypothetical protein [candidate division CSSED10-310 bacterium]